MAPIDSAFLHGATRLVGSSRAGQPPSTLVRRLRGPSLNLRASGSASSQSSPSRVVSLAGGMQNLKDLPSISSRRPQRLIRNTTARRGHAVRQWPGLGRSARTGMSYIGIVGADPDDVVVTTGSQRRHSTSSPELRGGRRHHAEAPRTWAHWACSARQADVVRVPMDEHIISRALTEEQSRNVRASGRTIKFIYIILYRSRQA